jgi:hypothetical protein
MFPDAGAQKVESGSVFSRLPWKRRLIHTRRSSASFGLSRKIQIDLLDGSTAQADGRLQVSAKKGLLVAPHVYAVLGF